MNLLRSLLARPVGVIAWAAALVVAGGWAAMRLPVEWVPTIELPALSITAAWPGVPAREVERRITAPIERQLQQLSGTALVESRSEHGLARLRVEIAEGHDVGVYVVELGEQLALLRRSLPLGVVPRVDQQIPEALRDEQGFMVFQLSGPLPPSDLRALAEGLAARLRAVPGVGSVRVDGGRGRELRVSLRQEPMSAYGVGVERIERELHAAMQGSALGTLGEGSESSLLYRPAAASLAELRRTVVGLGPAGAPVRLGDVARLELAPAAAESFASVDGEPVVSLTVDRVAGSHLLAVAEAVGERAETLAVDLPEGCRLLVADDRSEQVREELSSLARRGGVGLVLVVLVVLAVLRSGRAVVAVMAGALVALAMALLLLAPLGLTLNLITLAGLALVCGMLIDNSLVVVEQLLALRARGGTVDAELLRRAVGRVGLPLVGGTLTTMAILIPLVYASGDLKALFLPLALTVGVTLAASLVTGLVLVPVVLRVLGGRSQPSRPGRRRVLTTLRAVELPIRLAARRPLVVLVLVTLAIGLPTWLLPLRIGPAPSEEAAQGDSAPEPAAGPAGSFAAVYDRLLASEQAIAFRRIADPLLGGLSRLFATRVALGQPWQLSGRADLHVVVTAPPGTGVERTSAILSGFEQRVSSMPGIRRTLVLASGDDGYMRVLFEDDAVADGRARAIKGALIQNAAQRAGFEVSIVGVDPLPYSSGGGPPVTGSRLVARGSNYDQLERITRRFADRLSAQPRVVTVDIDAERSGSRARRQVLRLRWPPQAVVRTGVDMAALAPRLGPRLDRRYPQLYADFGQISQLPVRVTSEGAGQATLADLLDTPVSDAGASPLRLRGLAEVSRVPEQAVIERIDQRYLRYLEVEFRGPPRLAEKVIRAELAATALPPGYDIELPEEVFFSQTVRRQLGWLLLATLGVVYLVMVGVLGAWRLPAVVLASAGTGFLGVAGGFLITGASLAEGAFIGSVLLAGVAVNNGLLLVHRYHQLRCRRPHGGSGLLARLAVRQRLRPMAVTTLTSVAALVPFLVGSEPSDFWFGFAVTVAGGLVAATLVGPPVAVALLGLAPRRSA